MTYSYTAQPDWVFDQVLTYTAQTLLKDNLDNVYDSFSVEHTFASGVHGAVTATSLTSGGTGAGFIGLKWKQFTGNLDNDTSTTVATSITTIVGILAYVTDGSYNRPPGSFNADDSYEVVWNPSTGDVYIGLENTVLQTKPYSLLVFYT